ncbi:MAG: hypothetical protein WCK67_08000 [bacterium]
MKKFSLKIEIKQFWEREVFAETKEEVDKILTAFCETVLKEGKALEQDSLFTLKEQWSDDEEITEI